MKHNTALPLVQIILCSLMLAVSFYFEYVVELSPCILCFVQRIIIAFLLFITFVSLGFRKHRTVKLYCASLCIFFCVLGILLALRQSWMQLNPGLFAHDTCLPDISYMLRMFPISQVITTVLHHGGAACIKMQWALLGVPMPGWLAFSYTMVLSTYVYSLAPSKDD